MIQTYSPTIRRKEMEAVLTCLVDEKIGPGEMAGRLVQTIKELTRCDGALALRSPDVALLYALEALSIPKQSAIMISALAPAWQYITLERLGYTPLVLDVTEENGLVSPQAVEEGIKQGGRLLIFSETMGILPNIAEYLQFNIPIIEDISQSALSFYPKENAEATEKAAKPTEGASEENAEEAIYGRRAGMYGCYAIFGMEEHDIVTAGGGAVLLAPSRREWIVLKHLSEEASPTDFMPDMNAALALVELKEFTRNEATRQNLFSLYSRAVLSSRHKTFTRAEGRGSTVYSFPLVLNTGFKDVKAYANRKGIEIRQAFEDSVIALKQEALLSSCLCANSLLLRAVLFPLYPRLGQKDTERIIKTLSSLP